MMTRVPSRDRIKSDKFDTTLKRRPEWLRIKPPSGEEYKKVRQLMRQKELHTVCEEAHCPNIGECWGSGTSTFLILGDICTRSCRFCDIKHGKPEPIDWDEPDRVAQAVKNMNLRHAVITSVTRDDCKDGGATIFARIIERIREIHPGCSIEVLIPDFKGDIESLKIVMDRRPEILNHNVETVPSLFRTVHPQAHYDWSEKTLRNAKKLQPDVLTKSGLMIGIGETFEEIKEVMRDLRSWDVDILTIGQYLQPSKRHLAIDRYYEPKEFEALADFGKELGFKWVESAPLVRSSYRAVDQVRALSSVHQELYGNDTY
jgi:lipoic acid synthetase